MTKYTRTEILDTAKQLVNVDRASEHGDMEDNLTAIAEFWGIYLDRIVTPIKPPLSAIKRSSSSVLLRL